MCYTIGKANCLQNNFVKPRQDYYLLQFLDKGKKLKF